MDMPFFPGRKLDPPEPLAVFLPPFLEGTGTEFLRRLGKPKARIVDPFGQSPALALELARGGAAVLLASPNPVLRAILALQADPPAPQLIRSTLARLAHSPSSLSPDRRGIDPGNPGSAYPQPVSRDVRVLRQGFRGGRIRVGIRNRIENACARGPAARARIVQGIEEGETQTAPDPPDLQLPVLQSYDRGTGLFRRRQGHADRSLAPDALSLRAGTDRPARRPDRAPTPRMRWTPIPRVRCMRSS